MQDEAFHAHGVKLEGETLAEYALMSNNLAKLAKMLQSASKRPPLVLEQMRPLERQVGLVLTLYKASIWSVLVQREEEEE